MHGLTPFSCGPAGGLLVTTDGPEVLVCDLDTDDFAWSHRMPAEVVGVRCTEEAVLAVDAAGRLQRLHRKEGTLLGECDCQVTATGLAATAGGTWAVVHDGGAVVGHSEGIREYIPLAGTRFASFLPGEDRLGLATAAEVVGFGDDLQPGHRIAMDEEITGLGATAQGEWLVTTPQEMQCIAVDGTRRKRVGRAGRKRRMSAGVASRDETIFACRVDDHQVLLCGQRFGRLGSITWFDPERVGELEFGPHPWLGVGLGGGNGNLFSLTESRIHRTDPRPGREVHRWALACEIDHKSVALELQMRNGCLAAVTGVVLFAIGLVSACG